MLSSLSIKNIATIKSLEVNFGDGFNVLLGETGAGKSIIFDALGFVLGAKLDKTLLRSGESSMRVDAVFTKLNSQTLTQLGELGYEAEEELLLSRSYSEDGKSACRVNGVSATPAILKTISALLVDSYAQHDSLSLLNSKNHLGILDAYSAANISQHLEAVRLKYSEIKEIKDRINSIGGTKEEKARQIDLLSYQINEIEKLNLKPGEFDELSNNLAMAMNAEKLALAVSAARAAISESESSALSGLGSARSFLTPVSSNSEELEVIVGRLKSAAIEIEDIDSSLGDFIENISFNEKELREMDARLDLLKSVLRKYGGSEQSALEFLDESSKRLDELVKSDEFYAELTKALENKTAEYMALAGELSIKRKAKALEIEEKVIKNLADLSMKNAKFKIVFEDRNEISQNGIDDVVFYFSANIGESEKALSKTISGGELSRFMLAFKNVLAEKDEISTLVFDEIDSGISGEVGARVAEKIAHLSKSYQILCITHLAQVAAAADNYLFVWKNSVNGKTQSDIKELNNSEVIQQIAKLSGGFDLSEKALAHAEELRNKMQLIKEGA